MKSRMIIFSILLVLIVGCSGKTDNSGSEPAVGEIAKHYVMDSDEYKNLDGTSVEVVKTDQARCPGCFLVEALFTVPGEDEPRKVMLTIDNWEVSEAKFVSPNALTIEEAIALAVGTDCTEQGNLTDVYQYNENSHTWWINLDTFEKKEGCNPACVVYEETGNVEINWRCTGLVRPEGGMCEDLCGDGICAEMVCLSEGCPCAESPVSCPEDCS